MISIVIPCYNYRQYLPDCINSLFGGQTSLGVVPAQTITDFEAIIVNDASTDNTHAVALELSKLDRVRYVNIKKNRGTAGAFNAGVEVARGQWIMQLSADDMLEPYALERYLEIQEANPHSFVYGNQQFFAYGRKLRMFFKGPQVYDFEANLIQNHIPASMMYPRQAWLDMGRIPSVMGAGREDWATGIALGAWGYCGKYLHDGGYLYRREGQNRTLRNKKYMPEFADKIYQLFPKIYEGYRPMGCCGKRGATVSKAGRVRPGRQSIPGSQGMTKILYTGLSSGTQTFWGSETGHPYKAGQGKSVLYVDDRDLNGFLQTRDKDKRLLFSRAPVVKVEPVPLPPPKQDVVHIEAGVLSLVDLERSGDFAEVEATPAAKKLAEENGVSLPLLYAGQRITKRDVQRHIANMASDSSDL